MCLYPKLGINKKYTKTKKNGGKIPPITDERVKYIPIGCGNCMECRKQNARKWQIRLMEDIKENTNGKFITLTFSNESICKLIQQGELQEIHGYELDNAIATIAVKLFRERYRKKYKKSLRHFLITELGHKGTENIHMHGIIWSNISLDKIAQIWDYGYVWTGKGEKRINYVNEKTVNYIIKYVNKIDPIHKYYKSIILTSPGIGNNYMNNPNHKKNQYNGKETNELYRTRNGYDMPLPIYYRNKIYTEEQREQLWLNKLDKNERWVCGEKTKANDTKTYWKLVQWYRRVNKELGYGDDEKNWNRQQYEEHQRKIMYEKRTSKNNSRHSNNNNMGNNNTDNNNSNSNISTRLGTLSPYPYPSPGGQE